MNEPVTLRKAKLLTYYLPLKKAQDAPNKSLEKLSSELREAVLEQILKVFEGSTFVGADARTEKWGEESTTVFNVVALESPNLARNAEILGWLLLNILDTFKKRLQQGHEETFWFTEQEITLCEIKNPDYQRTGQHLKGES